MEEFIECHGFKKTETLAEKLIDYKFESLKIEDDKFKFKLTSIKK